MNGMNVQSCAATIAVMLLTACSPGSHAMQATAAQVASAERPSPFIITATIKELMDSTVDPSADGVWDSVAFVSSQDGMDDRKPRTEEEWKAVRRRAMTLVEAANLLVMDGRHAAPAGTQPGEGELSPVEIDHRIAATRPAFVGFAHGLQATALKALHAIDKRDSEGLFQAGGEIDVACEACHVTYWYPDQKVPTT
jgi:hypothetical protein